MRGNGVAGALEFGVSRRDFRFVRMLMFSWFGFGR